MRIVAPALMALAAGTATLSSAGGRPSQARCAFERIVEAQLSRYPEMRAQDLYKLALQAAMGSAHIVRDTAEAREWLDREAKDLPGGPAEPVEDMLSPDGAIVRVNLRPYLAAGGDLAALAAAFTRTARVYRGSQARLRAYLACVERMARAGRLPPEAADVRPYFAQMRRRGYPTPAHSPRYVQAYRPAYRVVLRELLTPSEQAAKP